MDTLDKILKLDLISKADYDCVRQLEKRRHLIDTRINISDSYPIQDVSFSVTIEINTKRADYESLTSITSIDYLRNDPTLKLDAIEKDLGMPQGHLSKAIKNKRALPKEWEVALKKYLLKKAETIKQQLS